MKDILWLLGFIIAFSGCAPEPEIDLREEWAKMHESKKESFRKFNENKFGMIIHFGAYSSLGGYWKGEKIGGEGEVVMRKAKIPREEYREVASRFNPVKFDAEEWVKTVKAAGMHYMVVMAKHAEGFSMYDSEVTEYNIVNLSPFGRDVLQELYDACQKHGVQFSLYYNYLDWMDGGNGRVKEYEKANPGEDKEYQYWANTWDPSPRSFNDYFENKCKPQLRELLERFPGIQEFWHDMPMKLTPQQSFDIYKLVYEIQPAAMDNSRIGNDFGDFWIPGDNVIPEEDKVYDHYGVIDDLDKVTGLPWETPGTMNDTWGYRSDDHNWKSTRELLFWLTSIVSRGGNYLLNVGPDEEGLFPDESVKRLLEIGEWLAVHGESVYGTEKWRVTQEGPTKLKMEGTENKLGNRFTEELSPEDFWFSKKGDHIYVTSLQWPRSVEALVRSFGESDGEEVEKIKEVRMLGFDQALHWEIGAEGLSVILPERRPHPIGYVLKVTLKE